MNAAQSAVVRSVLRSLIDDDRLAKWHPELERIADDVDDDVPRRLRMFYDTHIHEVGADVVAPTTALAKCVPVDRFLVRYAAPDVRAEYLFRPGDAYMHDVAGSADPTARLTSDLPEEPDATLIPAPHSWLIPASSIQGLSAAQLTSRLRLRSKGPYVRLELPLHALIDAGVRVRPPSAIDTVPAMDSEWEPGAVADEVIDGDIPRAACAAARWVA